MMTRIYIVPHFHYDAAWLKTKEEYLRMCHRHILEVLRLLKKHPRYCFLIEQAYLVKTFLARYPEQEACFREYVKKGRIELTGTYVCPDVNIPSGEALVRQIKLGKDYFRRAFGVDVTTGYMVDVFGNHPQLPQIMAGAGITSYIFGRGMSGKNRSAELIWRGIDGSEVLALWMPLTATNLWPVPGNYPEFADMVKRVAEELRTVSPTGRLLFMSGYDYSPPSPDLPVFVDRWKERGYDPCFIMLKDYAALVRRNKAGLPVFTADFNPCLQGCYSSRIGLKLKNRVLENALYQGESVGAMNVSTGHPAPAVPEAAWEKVLFNQFHDIICGSHVDEVYDEAMRDYGQADDLIRRHTDEVLGQLADSVNTEGDGWPVMVVNTLAWPRTGVVEVEFSLGATGVESVAVADSEMKPVVHQEMSVERFADGGLKMVRLAFTAESVPACGYRVYRVRPNQAGPRTAETIGARLLHDPSARGRGTYDGLGLVEIGAAENSFLSCRFDIKQGVFISVRNKSGRELIDPKNPLGGVIARELDEGDPWQYNEGCEGGETTACNRRFPFPVPWEADFSHRHQMPSMSKCDITPGPVFAEIVSDARYGSGWRTVKVRVYAKIPRIEVSTALVNNEHAVRYRIHVPTSITKGAITREIPFGAVVQPEGEFPVQNWLDYSDKTKGLGLLNRGIVGQGVEGSVMMMAATRSVNPLKDFPGNFSGGAEIGQEHVFHYALVPHAGDWRKTNLPRQGVEFNCPLLVYKTGCHPGKGPSEKSFLEVGPDNVIASMIRGTDGGGSSRAESRGLVVRVYETQGKKTAGTLKTGRIVTRGWETDLLEWRRGAKICGGSKTVGFTLGAYEIKSFVLQFDQEKDHVE